MQSVGAVLARLLPNRHLLLPSRLELLDRAFEPLPCEKVGYRPALVEERSRERGVRARTGAGGAVRSVCYSSVPGHGEGSSEPAALAVRPALAWLQRGPRWAPVRVGCSSAARESSRHDSVATRKLACSLVVWSLALSLCRNRRRRESVRAARGCAVQWRVHAARWALQRAKRRAEGVVCLPRMFGLGRVRRACRDERRKRAFRG